MTSVSWNDLKIPGEAGILNGLFAGKSPLKFQNGTCIMPEMQQFSEFLTPAEVAAILKVCEQTVINRFENFPGVIDLGSEETRRKRRYRVLRIPREALQKYILAKKVN